MINQNRLKFFFPKLYRIVLFSSVLLIASSISACSETTWISPTPLPNYRGSCTFWSQVSETWEGNTCVWGVPTSAETSFNCVWLHFSERNHPYPDFAGKITNYDSSWGFKVTGNNVSEEFVGHCIEIHGYLNHEYNSYNDKTVNQPIINIITPDQIVFCD